jgi:hypothetical protein
MIKFEYQRIDAPTRDAFVEALNRAGLVGWELVNAAVVDVSGDGAVFVPVGFLKREKQTF